MSDLRIARGLKLDPDYIGGGTLALLAKKGAGKTYAMRVLAEEFWKAKVPFVALDPMDAFWGLRSSADGEGEGIPVAVFGGPHGDRPLEKTGGKLMADLVVEEGLSMVLSTKHFGTRAAERQFAMDFLERLYRRNNELVHLLIDEADLFAPQKPNAGDQPLLAIAENIVRRGRNNGIGVTMASQRPAVLHKDVLNQVDGLVIMRLLGPRDRDAINEWVGEHGDVGKGREVKGTLPDLATGEAWVWVPELGVLERTMVRKSRTFDSSPTRKRGARSQEPKSFADVDLDAIESKMADTVERAKAEDPRELRKQLATERKRSAQLERDLGTRPTETQEVEVEKLVEVPVLANGVVEKLADAVGAIRDTGQQLGQVADGIAGELRRVSDVGRTQNVAQRQRQREERRPRRPTPAATDRGASRPASAAPPVAESVEGDGEIRLKDGMVRMLQALARLHPHPLTRVQVATLADIKPTSGSVSEYVVKLKRVGYVLEENHQLTLTPEGEALVADVVGTGAPSPEELRNMWAPKLKDGMVRMLDHLLEIHPDGIPRVELAEHAGISPGSGSVSEYVVKLKKNGLAEEHSHLVYAGEALFIGERV